MINTKDASFREPGMCLGLQDRLKCLYHPCHGKSTRKSRCWWQWQSFLRRRRRSSHIKLNFCDSPKKSQVAYSDCSFRPFLQGLRQYKLFTPLNQAGMNFMRKFLPCSLERKYVGSNPPASLAGYTHT